MRLFVVYDQTGKIIAATRLDYPPLPHGIRLVLPVVKPGHLSAELELPEEHAHLSFEQARREMMVDIIEGAPRLVRRAKAE